MSMNVDARQTMEIVASIISILFTSDVSIDFDDDITFDKNVTVVENAESIVHNHRHSLILACSFMP